MGVVGMKAVESIDFGKVIKYGFITIGGLIVLAIIVFIFIKTSKTISQAMSDKKRDKAFDDELNKLPKATLTSSQALTIANALQSLMAGVNFSNWGTVKNELNKIINTADWILVQKQFGVRNGQDLKEWLDGDGLLTKTITLLSSKGIVV